jgi:hypothetical protein
MMRAVNSSHLLLLVILHTLPYCKRQTLLHSFVRAQTACLCMHMCKVVLTAAAQLPLGVHLPQS